jgi:hypothetical protein
MEMRTKLSGRLRALWVTVICRIALPGGRPDFRTGEAAATPPDQGLLEAASRAGAANPDDASCQRSSRNSRAWIRVIRWMPRR